MTSAQASVSKHKRRRTHATRQRRWRRVVNHWLRRMDLAAVLLVGVIVLFAVGRLGGCSITLN